MDINSLSERAKKVEKETKTFFKSIKKNRHRELDDTIHAIHEEIFDSINCLDCGNCCRTLGPRITDRDIETNRTGIAHQATRSCSTPFTYRRR